MRFNEGMEHSDFMTMLAIAKEIGIENGKDLQRFKKEEVKDGESLVDAIIRYRDELGKDFKIEESFDEDDDLNGWEEIDSKQVRDSDGFLTDYTWYWKAEDGVDTHIMMFGDKDIYTPDEGYADAVFDGYEEAKEWFHSYAGFSEDDDLWESVKGPKKSTTTKEHSLMEYFGRDYSHVPEVKEIDFIGKPYPRVRGFDNRKFKAALDKVGLPYFKIKASRMNGVSLGDLRDEFGGCGMYPWTFFTARDSSVADYNEFYFFKKEETKDDLDERWSDEAIANTQNLDFYV